MTLLMSDQDRRRTASDERALPQGMRLLPVGDRLWRVLDRTGRVAGHLQACGDGAERRYVARRFHSPSAGFREIGSFWSAQEAVECLLLSR